MESLAAKRGTVLHVLSQRPTLTGSGITLDALAQEAAARGWCQNAVVGVPASALPVAIPPIPQDQIHPLLFETDDLDFPVPGMSDVMPYPSTVFSSMTDERWARYRQAWRSHLERVAAKVRPDVIHSHHLWLLSSVLKDCFPEVPVVTHSHSTGLRQMELCPARAPEIIHGVRRNDAFVCLHGEQARQIRQVLDVEEERIHVVGAGYRADLFHAHGRQSGVDDQLLYVGKLSHSKGLPQLLDAVERLARRHPGLRLHVAGSGAGHEAEALRRRLEGMVSCVHYHGQVNQGQLADLMRSSGVCVLPSFYEGLPLVLVEAAACGCRVVASALPGVVEQLAPALGSALTAVSMPRMAGIDTPVPAELPAFVDRLEQALEAAILPPPADGNPHQPAIEIFTWNAVFRRIEEVWFGLQGRLKDR